MRGWIVLLMATSLMVVVVSVAAIAVFLSSDSSSIVDLEVGDCFDLTDESTEAIETVDLIDCDAPHLAEVVAEGVLNPFGDRDYPDDASLFAQVEAACRAADVVVSADFGLVPVAPTPALWETFEGRYVCVAFPFGGEPVSGSIVSG